MAKIEIAGKVVEVEDSFLELSPEEQGEVVDEIAQSLGTIPTGPPDEGAFSAATSGTEAGMMYNWDDEIGGAMMAPIEATKNWFKGEGFDLKRGYTDAQQFFDKRKQMQREQHPVASGVGEIVGGGLAAGGLTAKGLVTGGAKLLPAMAEAAGHGFVNAAGDAEAGDKIISGIKGAAGGALAGGATQLATKGLTAAASRFLGKSKAPTTEQIAEAADIMYDKMRNAGTIIKEQSSMRLLSKLSQKAGSPNSYLRPKTMGIMKEANEMLIGDLDFKRFHELHQMVNMALEKADGNDKFALLAMKKSLEKFGDTLGAADLVSGKPVAAKLLKEADKLYTSQIKTQLIEEIMDRVDVRGGESPMGAIAQSAKTHMETLYNNKTKLGRFSEAEQKLIRQIAKGGSSSKTINFLAKFAPRNLVSMGIGSGLAGAAGLSAAGGAGGALGLAAVPAIGLGAAVATDRSSKAAMIALRNAAATGNAPVQFINKIPGMIPLAGSQAGGYTGGR